MSIIYTFRNGTKTSTIGGESYSNLFSDENLYNEVDTIFIEKDCALPAYNLFLGQNMVNYLSTGTLFSKCINLKRITVEAGSTYYSSDETGCLFSLSKKTLFAYPAGNPSSSYTIPDTVQTVYPYTFMNSKNLITVVIPNNSFNLLPLSFANSVGITTITIPNTHTIIPDYAFYNCINIEKIELPIGLKIIHIGAFTN